MKTNDDYQGTREIMLEFAGQHTREGDHVGAAAYFREAVEVELQLFGPDSIERVDTLRALANTYFNGGKYERAAETFEHVLRIQEEALGEKHPDVMDTLLYLAEACERCGRHPQAAWCQERLLQAEEHDAGEDTFWAGLRHTPPVLPEPDDVSGTPSQPDDCG